MFNCTPVWLKEISGGDWEDEEGMVMETSSLSQHHSNSLPTDTKRNTCNRYNACIQTVQHSTCMCKFKHKTMYYT